MLSMVLDFVIAKSRLLTHGTEGTVTSLDDIQWSDSVTAWHWITLHPIHLLVDQWTEACVGLSRLKKIDPC